MEDQQTHAVTGAFGYTGKYIARELLAKGHRVITLTNSLHRKNPFGESIKAFPFNFDRPENLAATLRGVEVLYNTYWVRFNYKTFTHADAVRNTLTMFKAAKDAGVKRIVHISITNPSADSPLEYFREKAKLETALKHTGISYAILRPAIIFGESDILINNIAWALRRFPVFGVFGDGQYRLQPIYVEDLADLAVKQGETHEDTIIDAIGPETFSYKQLVQEIGRIIGKSRIIVSVPPIIGFYASRLAGIIVRDKILTKEEIRGLMTEKLYVESSSVGNTKLTKWAEQHADTLGLKYSNELARRSNKRSDYGNL
jgi:NADH dehydrogenase